MIDHLAKFEARIERITETGCWIWTGSLIGKGYAQMPSGRRLLGITHAHRYSYMKFVGEVPEGMQVCHRCDIACCVNPNHLFLGTNQDNVDDMMRKGRHGKGGASGERNGIAKLTLEQVKSIRESNDSHSQLALKFGLHPKSIARIRAKRCWAT